MMQTHQGCWNAKVFGALSRSSQMSYMLAPWYVLVRTLLRRAQCNASDMQATARAYLDSESPFISLNSIEANCFGIPPLLYLAKSCGSGCSHSPDVPDTIALLLTRGADVRQRDADGNNCLHVLVRWNRDWLLDRDHDTMFYETYDELRDILTLMITAGADVYAINEEGTTVSEVAHAEGHCQVWAEVLETCGYDAEEVFQGYAADHGWSSGIDTPGKKPLAGCPLKLSFEAYLERREAERKAAGRITEIVDDETAEDDWVREFKEEQRRREAAHSAEEEEDDDDDDDDDNDENDDNESDAYQEESSVSDDNKTTWKWDEASDLSTEEGSGGNHDFESKEDQMRQDGISQKKMKVW
jgi:hypothetical protein